MFLTTKLWVANYIASLSMLNSAFPSSSADKKCDVVRGKRYCQVSFSLAFLDPVIRTITRITGNTSSHKDMNRFNSKL